MPLAVADQWLVAFEQCTLCLRPTKIQQVDEPTLLDASEFTSTIDKPIKMSQPSLNQSRSCLVFADAKLLRSVTAAVAVGPLSRP